jgi:hypothetical protein
MKKRKVVPCIICRKPVKQDKSTSVERQTCKRKKVDGVLVKSECEKEKNRRYQKKYRDGILAGGKPRSVLERSVGLSSLKHLAKHKAKKYKRHCLKCLGKFTGIGKYNRICNSCTIENSRQSKLKGG